MNYHLALYMIHELKTHGYVHTANQIHSSADKYPYQLPFFVCCNLFFLLCIFLNLVLINQMEEWTILVYPSFMCFFNLFFNKSRQY